MPPTVDETLNSLETALGHKFRQRCLLREAITHASLDLGERGTARFGYERLEFLGDRVLGLVVSEWLIERFPDEAEGSLARRHSSLISRDSLAEIATAIGLGQYLLLSSGEEGSGGRDNAAILADACEAVIAALYLDGGLEAARQFVRRAWQTAIERDPRPPQDPKTALQEWAQARGLPLPSYQTVSRRGPDHEPVFEVEVSVTGHEPAAAKGSSKRVAEKRAAAQLLKGLKKE